MLLSRIEQETIAHFREHDEELNDLRWLWRACEHQVAKVKCSTQGCKAIWLKDTDEEICPYRNCLDMFECVECGRGVCNKHVGCYTCETCESCSLHVPCEYCQAPICRQNNPTDRPPTIYKPGKCDCGEDLYEVNIVFCVICEKGSKLKRGQRHCHPSKVMDAFYECDVCKPDPKLIRPSCETCKLARHYGCRNYGECIECKKELCPRCDTLEKLVCKSCEHVC
jgi:hypothetical protein